MHLVDLFLTQMLEGPIETHVWPFNEILFIVTNHLLRTLLCLHVSVVLVEERHEIWLVFFELAQIDHFVVDVFSILSFVVEHFLEMWECLEEFRVLLQLLREELLVVKFMSPVLTTARIC